MLWLKKTKTIRHFSTFPFIILPFPFLLMSDIVGEIYHQVAFSLCGIEKVKRSEYIQIRDRAKLQYLRPYEKIFCMYCGYTNGLLRYQKEIAGRTEKYWCGIMHQGKPGFKPQEDQIERDFAKYNDVEDFNKKYSVER